MSDPKEDKLPYEMPPGYNDTGIPIDDGDDDTWRPKFSEEEMEEWGRKTTEWWRQKQERAKQEKEPGA